MITVSCLGNNGRFGNQLFQYAYARAYADKIGAELQTPDWIGRHLFKGINETIMTHNAGASTEHPAGDNVDLFGYFQQDEHLALLSKDWLKSIFIFKDEPKVKKEKLVFHKRRGDYLFFQNVFAIVSDSSYDKAAMDFGFNPSDALCLDDNRGSEFMIEDFVTMMRCDTLFRGNSTFSWWAAAIGECEVYSPIVSGVKGHADVIFKLGNDESICDETGTMFLKQKS